MTSSNRHGLHGDEQVLDGLYPLHQHGIMRRGSQRLCGSGDHPAAERFEHTVQASVVVAIDLPSGGANLLAVYTRAVCEY